MMTLGNVSESTANIGCELVARCAVTRRHSARARAGAARASARFEFLAQGVIQAPLKVVSHRGLPNFFQCF
jgi:hypothetical protein